MTQPRQLAVILNPVAGAGHGQRAWSQVRRLLDAGGVRWSLHETEAPGHATALTGSILQKQWADSLLVVGGDGTINEVVNGLVDASVTDPPTAPDQGGVPGGQRDGLDAAPSEPLLGVIPVGHGNDFAKPLRLPVGNPADAVRVVLDGVTRCVDVGRVNGRCFVNGVGIGLDGFIALEVRRTRRLPGFLMYLVAVVRGLRTYHNATVRITCDGRTDEREIALVNVTNGPCHGGGFWICPHALVDDGLLDVCIADAMSTSRLVPRAVQATRGTHVGKPGISFDMARHVTIESDVPLPSHVDGEILGEKITRLDVAVLPGRLSVFVPGGERGNEA